MGKLADYIGKYWAGAEVMYAVIIAMTFTSVLWNAEFAPDFVKENIVQTALACCIAWGFADGLFYIWERKYILNQERQIVSMSKDAGSRQEAVDQVRSQLDDSILRNIEPKKRERLYHGLVNELADVDEVAGLDRGWAIRILSGTIILAAIAGVLILAPIYFLEPLSTAILVSNILGIMLLFAVGFNRAYGKPLSLRFVNGGAAAVVGLIIALITTFLGG
jgi:VIT1/CCC1 family predicted Fe2+/Mn2+ transporter